jgi:2-methylcitrate dehydratase PrpD
MNSRHPVQQLLDFAADMTPVNLPERVLDRTKLAILDFFGNVLGALGTNHEVVNALLNLVMEMGGKEESTILGSNRRVPCLDAAMTHGVLGNFLDYSDGHFMGGHINDRVVPAALAVSEKVRATGSEFITAVLAGYETYVRIAYALFGEVLPASDRHSYRGALGVLGSSVAAGKLLKLTAEQMAGAIGLAASIQNCVGQYTLSGGHEKTLSPGHESRRAVLSALMAQKGVLGSGDILQGERGLRQISGGPVDIRNLNESLGESYKIEECYFKPYPACRYLHSSIDAATNISKESNVDAKAVKEIKITTNHSSARRNAQNILSHVSAIFSHQYQVAVVLAEGNPDLPTAWREKMQKGSVPELIRKTTVVSSPEFDDMYRTRTLDHGTWPSTVEISAANGHRYQSTVLRPKGDPTNPMTCEELESKFRRNASAVLAKAEVDRLAEQVHRMERVEDIREFCRELASQIKRARLLQ